MASKKASSVPVSNRQGPHKCKYCEATFRTDDELRAHKKEKFNDEECDKDRVVHAYCSYCNTDFNHYNTLVLHYRQVHKFSKMQDIICPGCESHHNSVSEFILHLENQECTKITFEIATARYNKNIQFSRKLNTLDNQRGGHKQQKDFSGYLARHYRPEVPRWNPASDGVADTCAWKFADWGDKDEKPDARAAAPTTKQATEQIQQSQTRQNTTVEQSSGIQAICDDPKDPRFNAARFYNKFTRKYDCPKSDCSARPKTRDGLIQHLLSPKHAFYETKVSMICPSCNKRFRTLSGLAAHVERPAQGCGIHHSDIFEIFVWQMTWGIIEVKGRDAEFYVPIYGVSAKAKTDFAAAEPIQPEAPANHQHQACKQLGSEGGDGGGCAASATTSIRADTTNQPTAQPVPRREGFFMPQKDRVAQSPAHVKAPNESLTGIQPNVAKVERMVSKFSFTAPEDVFSFAPRGPMPEKTRQAPTQNLKVSMDRDQKARGVQGYGFNRGSSLNQGIAKIKPKPKPVALTLDALDQFDEQDEQRGGFFWSAPRQKDSESGHDITDVSST